MRKKQPLVSVIVPAYNAAAYVKDAVDSALAQTYKNIEIIVVDDGSTDNTKAVLDPLIKKKKIRYVYQANLGLAAARNAGIKNSKGGFVALLDADDLFLPEKIERQVAYLEAHPECDISYCNLFHFWDGESGKLLQLDYRCFSGDDVLPNLVKRDFIAPLTMVVRRAVFERFGPFDQNFRRSEDLEFLVRILSRGARICFLDERLAKLRLRRTSNLQGFESQPEVKRTGLRVFENLYLVSTREERERLELKKYLARYRLKVGLAYLENQDKAGARPFIVGAFKGYAYGRIWGVCLWLPFAIFPVTLLAAMIRRYHIKRQKSHLLPHS